MKVLVDGQPLPDDEARALWTRFSAFMEEHKGDLAGFAAAEGLASVHPSIQGGKPVLLASRTAPQQPYAPVRGEAAQGGDHPTRGSGGSSPRQPEGKKLDPARNGRRRNPGKPRG